MNAPRATRGQLLDAGFVAGVVLLALSATCACVHAQNSPTVGASAEARTACDAELAARVKAALRAAPAVNDIHIDVHCEKGKVVLTGLVEDERALLDALQVAKKAAQGHPIMDALSIMKTSPR